MNLETFSIHDLEALPSLQPDGWQDIRPAFSLYTRLSFCHPRKITIDGHLAAVGTAICHHDTAWLGHIIVHPEYRRKGLGLFMTEQLVKFLERTPAETIYLLATELGAPVYEKAGFITETEYLFYRDLHFHHSEPDPSIVPFHPGDEPGIAELDKRVSGENRFFHIKNYLDNGWSFKTDGAVKGFYLPDLGDGLIIAENAEAGIALMQRRLIANVKACFPMDNRHAVDFFDSHHQQKYASGKRMRLGKKRPLKFDHIYNRIAGNLG